MIAPVTHDKIISYDDFIMCKDHNYDYVEIYSLLKSRFRSLLNDDIVACKIDSKQNIKVFYFYGYKEILIKSFNLNHMEYRESDNFYDHDLSLFEEIIIPKIIQTPYPSQWKNEMYRYDIFDDRQQVHVDVSNIDSIHYFIETFEVNIPYFVLSELNIFKNNEVLIELVHFAQKTHEEFVALKENSCCLTTLETLKEQTEKFAEHIAKTAERKLVKKVLSDIVFEKNHNSSLKNILSGSDLFDSDLSNNQLVKEYIFNKVKVYFANIDSVERDAILYSNIESDWVDELDYEYPIESISDVIDEDHTIDKISRSVLNRLMMNI